MDTAVAYPAPIEPRPRRRRAWRIAKRVLLAIVAVVFGIWLVLFVTKGRFLKHPFENLVGGALNREVRVAGDFQLYFAPFAIHFVAEGLDIANPAWATRPRLFNKLKKNQTTMQFILGRVYWG